MCYFLKWTDKQLVTMDIPFLVFDKGLNFGFLRRKRKVFLIHGHDEANLFRLQKLLYDLDLKPIVLSEINYPSSEAIIERFEKVGSKCHYAIALCTPDDLIHKEENEYSQPRPNVIYELGWFCGKKGRKRVMILLKEQTNVFSDFHGIIYSKFKEDVYNECYPFIHRAFRR